MAKKSDKKTKDKKTKLKEKVTLSRDSADRHALYQRSVQDPNHEVVFLSQIYREKNGSDPLSLREDFCGTGLLCATWSESDPKRTAVGLDIDEEVLAWGQLHNVDSLPREEQKRVSLRNQDVLIPTKESFDVVCAFNYSYSLFAQRKDLANYLASAYRATKKGGFFVMDAWGGWEAQQVLTERRKVGPSKPKAGDGFIYVWEQAYFNPINCRSICHIHFEFKDGSKWKKAFTYDWRLYNLKELQELLLETGFSSVDVYWEGEDENGEGTGTFTKTVEASNDPGWNAYLVAHR